MIVLVLIFHHTLFVLPTLFLLCKSSCKLKTMGERAFSFKTPKLWNAFPPTIRNTLTLGHFKKLVKMHLVKVVFNCSFGLRVVLFYLTDALWF